jgi:hypothetical protein
MCDAITVVSMGGIKRHVVFLLPSFISSLRKLTSHNRETMLPATSNTTPSNTTDDCSICLNALVPGSPMLTLSCNHKFHLQCLASNVQAQNKECPLCRAVIDASVVQLLAGPHLLPPVQQQAVAFPFQVASQIPTVNVSLFCIKTYFDCNVVA